LSCKHCSGEGESLSGYKEQDHCCKQNKCLRMDILELSEDTMKLLNCQAGLLAFVSSQQEKDLVTTAFQSVRNESFAEGKEADKQLNFYIASYGDLAEKARNLLGGDTSLGILDIPSQHAFQSGG
jgi:hypothetical protein